MPIPRNWRGRHRSVVRRRRLLLKKMPPVALLVSFWSQSHLTREMERAMSGQFHAIKAIEKAVTEVESLTANLEATRKQLPEYIEAVEEDGQIAKDLQEQDDPQLDWEGKRASGKLTDSNPKLNDLTEKKEARDDGPSGQGFQDQEDSQEKPVEDIKAKQDGSTDNPLLDQDKSGIDKEIIELVQSSFKAIPSLENKEAEEDGSYSPGLQDQEYHQNTFQNIQDQPTEKDGSTREGFLSEDHSNRPQNAPTAEEPGTAVLNDQVQRSTHLKRLRFIFRLPIYVSHLQHFTHFQPRLPRFLPHTQREPDIQDQGHSQQNKVSHQPRSRFLPFVESQSNKVNIRNQEHSQANWETFAPSGEETDVVGMADQVEDLVHLVLGNQRLLFLISVVGPPGSGKTTLVRRVCTRINVRQHVQCFAWISVSKELEEKNLLIEVLSQVTLVRDEERLPLDLLRQKVRSFLSRKRYLIVFDDVHSLEVWNTIKMAFPNPLNGSRVILCIRVASDGSVLKLLTYQWIAVLKVRQLDEEESWALFLRKLRKRRDRSIESELISLKKKIWSKSEGLPLAIVLLGGLLSTKNFDYREWSEVIDKATLNADQSTSKDILTVVYQDLPSPLKVCLLYLGLFPRSYQIPIRRLLQLWIAEGLAPTVGQNEDTEDLVEGYLKELVARSMIEVPKWRLDGSPRTCQVPGILYDNLFPSATKMGFYHVQNNFDYTAKHVRRIAEYVDIGDYPDSDPYNIKHLRSYISFNVRKGDSPTDGVDKLLNKIVGNRAYGLLLVLDLEHVYKPVLSETLGKLLHLKYLGLRWTFLDLVPASIGKLGCLETLDLKHTNITTLPISIWNATKLRHLYLNDIHFDLSTHLQNSSSIRGFLANLRTLWDLLIGKNSSVVKWLRRLTSLRKLGLTCHVSSMEQIMNWISALKDLQSLRLRSIDEFSRPSDLNLKSLKEHSKLTELYLLGKLPRGLNVDELPKSLKILTLSVSQLKKDPMPILGKLPHLNILRLFAHSYWGEEMRSPSTGFAELRVLKLWMLEDLKKWTVEEGSMPCLKELEIRCCTKLEPPAGLKHVTTLREFTLTNMPTDFEKQVKENLKNNYVYISVNLWDFPNSRKDETCPERQELALAPQGR